MIDAAELARLRRILEEVGGLSFKTVLALLDALEQARRDNKAGKDALRIANEDRQLFWAERDEAQGLLNANEDAHKLAIAERDAARALLKEADEAMGNFSFYRDIRARIAAELGEG